MDLYLDVFLQGFLSRLIPWKYEVMLFSNWIFGREGTELLAVIGSIGGLLGYAVLYALGAFLYKVSHKVSTDEQQERSASRTGIANKLIPVLLVFASVRWVGSFFVIAAGYYRIDKRKAAFALILSEIMIRTIMFTH